MFILIELNSVVEIIYDRYYICFCFKFFRERKREQEKKYISLYRSAYSRAYFTPCTHYICERNYYLFRAIGRVFDGGSRSPHRTFLAEKLSGVLCCCWLDWLYWVYVEFSFWSCSSIFVAFLISNTIYSTNIYFSLFSSHFRSKFRCLVH